MRREGGGKGESEIEAAEPAGQVNVGRGMNGDPATNSEREERELLEEVEV